MNELSIMKPTEMKDHTNKRGRENDTYQTLFSHFGSSVKKPRIVTVTKEQICSFISCKNYPELKDVFADFALFQLVPVSTWVFCLKGDIKLLKLACQHAPFIKHLNETGETNLALIAQGPAGSAPAESQQFYTLINQLRDFMSEAGNTLMEYEGSQKRYATN